MTHIVTGVSEVWRTVFEKPRFSTSFEFPRHVWLNPATVSLLEITTSDGYNMLFLVVEVVWKDKKGLNLKCIIPSEGQRWKRTQHISYKSKYQGEPWGFWGQSVIEKINFHDKDKWRGQNIYFIYCCEVLSHCPSNNLAGPVLKTAVIYFRWREKLSLLPRD